MRRGLIFGACGALEKPKGSPPVAATAFIFALFERFSRAIFARGGSDDHEKILLDESIDLVALSTAVPVSQIVTRRNDFSRATEVMGALGEVHL